MNGNTEMPSKTIDAIMQQFQDNSLPTALNRRALLCLLQQEYNLYATTLVL